MQEMPWPDGLIQAEGNSCLLIPKVALAGTHTMRQIPGSSSSQEPSLQPCSASLS
jgi:hypothetical protein